MTRLAPLKAVSLFLALVAGIMAVLLFVGVAKVNANDGNSLGIYSSALRGLPAFWSPLINLVSAAEFLALVAMPGMLWLLRKKFRLSSVPWLVGLIVVALIATNPHWRASSDNVDPEAGSFVSDLLRQQLEIALAIAVGYVGTWLIKVCAKTVSNK